jgi:hypothetical protein
MSGSPVTSWDGAEAIYTFADKPALIALFLVLTAVVVVGAIIHSAKHETKAFKRFP